MFEQIVKRYNNKEYSTEQKNKNGHFQYIKEDDKQFGIPKELESNIEDISVAKVENDNNEIFKFEVYCTIKSYKKLLNEIKLFSNSNLEIYRIDNLERTITNIKGENYFKTTIYCFGKDK